MIYTVEQLIEDFRSDVFDRADTDDDGNAVDTLWSDEDVLRYMNSAAARWASDTLALRRRFEFPVAAGQALVRFPYSEILDDLVVSFVAPALGRRRSLTKFDIDEGVVREDYGTTVVDLPDLDRTGLPTHYTRDYDNQFLRLWPVPYVAGTVAANAYVLPQQLYPQMPVPSSDRKDLDLLLMWMKKLAYAKQNADTLDLERSKEFEREYRFNVTRRASEIDRLRRDVGIMRSTAR